MAAGLPLDQLFSLKVEVINTVTVGEYGKNRCLFENQGLLVSLWFSLFSAKCSLTRLTVDASWDTWTAQTLQLLGIWGKFPIEAFANLHGELIG